VPSIDLLDNVVGIGGPGDGFGFAVVFADVSLDGGLQVDQRAEDAALQSPADEGGKEGFHRIGPGAGSRREMKHPAGVLGEPGAHFGMLVGGVVVEDGMDEFAGRYDLLDAVEETDEHLVVMSRHALTNEGAVEDIERGGQGGRARSDIIVGHCPGAALLYRLTRLGAVECLNLRLLVDRQNQTMGRRV